MSQKKKKPQDFTMVNGALHWKEGPPYVQNINTVKEPEASKIAEKLKYSSNVRQLLCSYYLNGGNQYAYGSFKGRVTALRPIKRSGGTNIMFKPLYVSFIRPDGKTVEGKEDHLWIQDNGAFSALGLAVGKCYEFNATTYLYKHPNSNDYEFSLEKCDNVRLVSAATLPDPKQLERSMWDMVACDYCTHNLTCSRKECKEQEWRKEMVWGLTHPAEIKKKPVRIDMGTLQKELGRVLKEEVSNSPVWKISEKETLPEITENTNKKTWMVRCRECQSKLDKIMKIYGEVLEKIEIEKTTI